MPYIEYAQKNFQPASLTLIAQANQIVSDYTAQGFNLTLRQLYYQLVSRDIIANNMLSYKRLGSIINDGRLAGLVDWLAIEDRTRNLQSLNHWESVEQIVRAVAGNFRVDKWAAQANRVEVWVEKDALVDVVARACNRWDVPYFACRGYTSQSEMWRAGERLNGYYDAGQTPVILHLGDHDPSGIDMTRDISDRLEMFTGQPLELYRLALNWEQIEQYNPPPNPAKLTDSRSDGYVSRFGLSSWELDALEPQVIVDMIETNIQLFLDMTDWDIVEGMEAADQEMLRGVARRWGDIVRFLNN